MTEPAFLPEDPRRAAATVAREFAGRRAWLDEFSRELDRCRSASALERVLRAWDLSQAEAGRLFGVSRQAVSKWQERGVPAERAETLARLAAATDLLERYLQRDRIPAVVRRQAQALAGRSLLELAAAGDTAGVLTACREMFAFDGAQA